MKMFKFRTISQKRSPALRYYKVRGDNNNMRRDFIMNNSIPVDRQLFIEIIFNAIEKGNKTTEFEATAIADVVSSLYSKIENQAELISKQDDVIHDLVFKIEKNEKTSK